LDGQPSEFFFFLSGLQKLEKWAKKCIGLRGEYVEQILILVAVSFLVGLRTYQHPLVHTYIGNKDSYRDYADFLLEQNIHEFQTCTLVPLHPLLGSKISPHVLYLFFLNVS